MKCFYFLTGLSFWIPFIFSRNVIELFRRKRTLYLVAGTGPLDWDDPRSWSLSPHKDNRRVGGEPRPRVRDDVVIDEWSGDVIVASRNVWFTNLTCVGRPDVKTTNVSKRRVINIKKTMRILSTATFR